MKTIIEVVEAILPTYIMARMVDQAVKSGLEFRDDMHTYIKRGLEHDLGVLSPLYREQCLQKVASVGETVIKSMNVPTAQAGLLATAHFMLRLIETGLYKDKKHVTATVSMLLLVEASEDDSLWGIGKAAIEEASGRMLNSARWCSLYLQGPKLML